MRVPAVYECFGLTAPTAYMFIELVPGILDRIAIPAGNGTHTTPMAWMAIHAFAHMPTPGLAAFAFSFFTLAYCFVAVWIMYKMKIFVKV